MFTLGMPYLGMLSLMPDTKVANSIFGPFKNSANTIELELTLAWVKYLTSCNQLTIEWFKQLNRS